MTGLSRTYGTSCKTGHTQVQSLQTDRPHTRRNCGERVPAGIERGAERLCGVARETSNRDPSHAVARIR